MEMGALIAFKEQKFEAAAVLYRGSQKVRTELQIPLHTYEEQDFLDLERNLAESLSTDVQASIKSTDLPLEELINISEEIFLS